MTSILFLFFNIEIIIIDYYRYTVHSIVQQFIRGWIATECEYVEPQKVDVSDNNKNDILII